MGVQQNRAIQLAERCKLDQRPLDKGQRPRRGKVSCLLHNIVSKGNNNGPNQIMNLKEEPMFWRTILEGRV
jgi:hypothetical protein